MNFDAYARTAVDLVNAPMEGIDDLRAVFVVGQAWMRDEATERDVTTFRRAQKRLRDVFELGCAGRDTEAVNELNTLLKDHPVQPRISGHDASDWHMHVTSRGASVSAEYLAGAVWGLAVWLCSTAAPGSASAPTTGAATSTWTRRPTTAGASAPSGARPGRTWRRTGPASGRH